MKKIFTLVVAVVFAASSFAQVSLQNMNGKVKTNNFKGIEKSVKSSDEGWISMAAYLEGYWGEGSVENGSGNYLQIDSLGLAQFGDEYSHPWFFSVSQTYDFTSSFWTNASVDGHRISHFSVFRCTCGAILLLTDIEFCFFLIPDVSALLFCC